MADQKEPTKKKSVLEDSRIRDYRDDLTGAERKFGREVQVTPVLWVSLALAVGLVITYFLPFSGTVLGFDILLDTDIAEANRVTLPERIFSVLMLVTILLVFATLLSRSSGVAFVAWAASGISAVYSVFAGWMRQSRQARYSAEHIPGDAGAGISYGLIAAIALSFMLAIALSVLVFRRSNILTVLQAARREEVHSDPVLREQQVFLRSGLTPRSETELEIVDDRRAKARERQRAARERAGSAEATEQPSAEPEDGR